MVYCIVENISTIAELAIEYRKIREGSGLTSSLKKQEIMLESISKSIKSYSNLIRCDIQSLMHLYFKSAYENLCYALTASPENRGSYILQARSKFIDAITIEKNENLILSYLGLALCQVLTNDMENSFRSLNKIKSVFFSSQNLNEDDFLHISLFSGFRLSSLCRTPPEKRTVYLQYFKGKLDWEKYIERLLPYIPYIPDIFHFDTERAAMIIKKAELKMYESEFEAFKSDVLSQFEL